MKDKTKNIISVVLPIVTIFAIAFIFTNEPTGFVVYENRSLYKIRGNVSVGLQKEIPADSYIGIKIDDYEIKINLIEFLEKTRRDYEIIEENNAKFVVGEGVYSVDFDSLGIVEGFEEGEHIIRTEIVYRNSILYSDRKIITI